MLGECTVRKVAGESGCEKSGRGLGQMECCFLGQNWEDCEARGEVLGGSYLDREGTELWREGMTIKPSLSHHSLLCQTSLNACQRMSPGLRSTSMRIQCRSLRILSSKIKTLLLKASCVPDLLCAE